MHAGRVRPEHALPSKKRTGDDDLRELATVPLAPASADGRPESVLPKKEIGDDELRGLASEPLAPTSTDGSPVAALSSTKIAGDAVVRELARRRFEALQSRYALHEALRSRIDDYVGYAADDSMSFGAIKNATAAFYVCEKVLVGWTE